MLGALGFLLAIILFFGQYRYISIFIVFVLVTAGFQMIPLKYMTLSELGITKSYDWVLLFEGTVLILKPDLLFNFSIWKENKSLLLYGLILLLLLINSIFLLGIEPSVSIRVFRGLLFFTTLLIFTQLSVEEIRKVFYLIIVATSISALLYCLQQVLHVTLLNKIHTDDIGTNSFTERYYNLPVYIYPAIFFLLLHKSLFKSHYTYLILIVTAILLSQHRNLLLAVILCFVIHYLFIRRFSLSKLFFALIICLSAFTLGNVIWNNRFSKGFDDISHTSIGVSPVAYYDVDLTELSTFEFRKLLLQERMSYILETRKASLLGIGLLTDDSKKASQLNFNIGMSDGYGNVSQIASSDITWSTLILQLGLTGLITFILFHLALLKNYFSLRNDAYMQVGILFIVCLLITSFFSNTIVQPYITTLLMLFSAYHFNLNKSPINK